MKPSGRKDTGGFFFVLNAGETLPLFVLGVTNKAEITFIPTLTKGLGTLKIRIRQISIIDDVAMAEHRTETV